MRILICNDDGIFAPGLMALVKAFTTLGEVYVSAPDSERSAASNALTIGLPLRAKETNLNVEGVKAAYAVSGTPADCAKLAMAKLMPELPDLVVSGINKGGNMCCDITYSGTVAGACEGAFVNILSLAVSLNSYDMGVDYTVAADWAVKVAKKLIENKVEKNYIYNLNVPCVSADQIKGLKITRVGNMDYEGGYEKRIDTFGKPYYWVSAKPVILDKAPECDVNAVADNYVSLTPLMVNTTATEVAKKLKEIF